MGRQTNDQFISDCIASGKYQISRDGLITNSQWNKTGTPRAVKINRKPSGYLKCVLHHPRSRESRVVFVHRVIAIAFHGMPASGDLQVDHINRHRDDNRAENLEWVSPAINQQRAWPFNVNRAGQICGPGEKSRQAKVTETQAIEIRRRCAEGETQRQVGLEFGITQSAVWLIVHKKNWKHLPE